MFPNFSGVKDIHTCLEITVYDEDPNNKFEFMGKVVIPLFWIRNCERRWYALKDKKLLNRVKGELLLELDIIWNPVRAAIRTFNPKEKKYVEQEPKFKAGLFRSTVMELKEFGIGVVEWKNYLQSCFNWDSTPRSISAFIVSISAPTMTQKIELRPLERTPSRESEEAEEEKRSFFRSSTNKSNPKEVPPKKEENSSTSIRDTLSSVQETLGIVQNLLVIISELLQRIKNTLNFTTPWLSWLAVLVLSLAAILLYLVPLRWIVMIWGINKFTKKLRNPHFIDNNELFDFLSRVPCDNELNEWRDIRVDRINEHRKSK